MQQRIHEIQQALSSEKIDAWLFVDFRYNDRFMSSVLKLDESLVQSRRCAYLVPAHGTPVKILHAIEAHQFDHLPGETLSYVGWKEWENALERIVKPYKTVAMQYSPENAIPTVAIADAGTVDLVRKFGPNVVSSATLLQHFEAVWTDEEYHSHKRAMSCLHDCVSATFAEIGRRVRKDGATDEYAIQQFICDFFEQRGMLAHHAPVVAVNANSANPHYEPKQSASTPIRENDFVLIDLWCKEKNRPRAMYADITWTGFVGTQVPKEYAQIFSTVMQARNAAYACITNAYIEGRPITGAEADQVCRDVIANAGYGDKFIHRTGHSIGEDVHGSGANIDNLETRDERHLIPRTCFSLEPGIYLPGKFGIRSEVDVYIHPDGKVEETGGKMQTEIVAIL